MDIRNFLTEVSQQNIKLYLENDRLKYRAPGILPPDIKDRLIKNKDKVIAFLKNEEAAVHSAENTCVGSENWLYLKNESILDSDICDTIKSLSGATGRKNNYQSILITGSSGFLGSYILHYLLKLTSLKIYCLVRAADRQAGLQKIIFSLKKYLLWSESYEKRIIPVVGDITHPDFNLSYSHYQELCNNIDIIYHIAAEVNWIKSYTDLKAINVNGTKRILRFACTGKVKPLHYVSTVSVFPVDAGRKFYLNRAINNLGVLPTGYAKSKWVAERLVAQSIEAGLPGWIYRPGDISGDSRNGFFNSKDFLCNMIKGSIQLGYAFDTESFFDFTPVDFMAHLIVFLSLKTDSNDSIYNLTNPNPLRCLDLINWMRDYGFKLAILSFEDWKKELIKDPLRFKENALYNYFPFLDRINKGLLTFPVLDISNVMAALKGAPLIYPEIDTNLLSIYFSEFINSGFIDKNFSSVYVY